MIIHIIASNVSIFLSLLSLSLLFILHEMMFELKFHRLLCKQEVVSIVMREQLLVTQIVDRHKHISNILEVVCLDSDVEIGTFHSPLSLKLAAEYTY